MTIGDQSMPMFQDETTQFTEQWALYPCSTVQGFVPYLSLMRPGTYSITSLDQANNPCSTNQTWVGHLSLVRPGCFSITLLDQQSLSQAWIECGDKPL